MLTPCYVPVSLDSSGMCSNVPSKSVVLCLQVPLDPEILYISHALLVKSVICSACFFKQLQVLEAEYIRTRDPVLCKQKENVVALTLFK